MTDHKTEYARIQLDKQYAKERRDREYANAKKAQAEGKDMSTDPVHPDMWVTTLEAELKRLGLFGHVGNVKPEDLKLEIFSPKDPERCACTHNCEKGYGFAELEDQRGKMFVHSGGGMHIYSWSLVGREYNSNGAFPLQLGVAVIVNFTTQRLELTKTC